MTSLTVTSAPALSSGPTSRTATVASRWLQVSGTPISDALLAWPADLFALTHVVLQRSQAFRLVLSPPAGEHWPPIAAARWSETVQDAALAWRASLDDGGVPLVPPVLADAWAQLLDGVDQPLEELEQGSDWPLCQALLTLHAIADEACAVLFGATDGEAGTACLYRARCRELLARTGSLSRIGPRTLRVLPKVRTPPTGRASFSRYACVVEGGVEVHWHNLPYRSPVPARRPSAYTRCCCRGRCASANRTFVPWRARCSDSTANRSGSSSSSPPNPWIWISSTASWSARSTRWTVSTSW